MERLWKMWQHLYNSLSLLGEQDTDPSIWNHNNTCATPTKIQTQKPTLPVLMHQLYVRGFWLS